MLEELLKRIRANDPIVTQINLQRNKIGAEGAQVLAEALKTNQTVTQIDLGSNNIGDAGAQALADVLKLNTTVTTIILGWNKIGTAGTQALANVLKVNNSVTAIYLNNNNIGAAGARALADVLKLNTTVTTIILWDNNIGAAGAQALADALKVNTTVMTINLDINNIGDAGARALADALKVNISVTTIHLNNNNIGVAGAQALADALKVNTAVTTIDLEGNKIGDAGARALAEAIKHNTSLSTINLKDNRIGDAGSQALAEALKTNTLVTEFNSEWNTNIGAAGTQAEAEIQTYRERNKTKAETLITAVKQGDINAVKNLLNEGVSVNHQDKDGNTALHYAIQQAHLEIVYLLLASPQKSPNIITSSLLAQFKDKNGNTLLHQAVRLAEQNAALAHKLIASLLPSGANRYVKNEAGQYPFQLCSAATEHQSVELSAISNLLKPKPAEQLFIDQVANNTAIKPLIKKLSNTFLAMDELAVSLRSNKAKQTYQLPGYLGIRLLFEELQTLLAHLKQDAFDCEKKSTWEQFLTTCLSDYEKLTDTLSQPQVLVEQEPTPLSEEESEMIKDLILHLQHINQLIFQDRQASSHRDEVIQNICIPEEWGKTYGLQLTEVKTSKKHKRETDALQTEETATADDTELPSAKRQQIDDLSAEELRTRVHELEQSLALSQAKITELEQRFAEAVTAKESENTRLHSMAFFPTLRK